MVNGPYFNSKYTEGFETEFAKFVGVNFCTTVASGTSALELSIKALELPVNSIILTTANAGGYAAIAARNAGFQVRYVDVDDFGLIDLINLEQSLEGASAIIVTHLYGQVCDMNTLIEIASRNHLKVIEDCAQAVGSTFSSMHVGSLGDIAAFSFYPTKNLGGIGDSGAVGTNSQILSYRVRQLREYGWTERYSSTVAGGGNHRNDEIQSLVLLDQLATLKSRNEIRKRIWNRYSLLCEDFGVQILGHKADDFVPHLAVLKVARREEFIKHMGVRNIGVAIHYPFPDYDQPGLKSSKQVRLPRTSIHCDQVVSVPLFPELSEAEISHVEEGLNDFFRRNGG
ncbi:cell wall aminitransferase [Candidatus Planktophila dulcis]|nr:cell wall aminitransferase [Candidatus Planktophila dulcis]